MENGETLHVPAAIMLISLFIYAKTPLRPDRAEVSDPPVT